MRVLRGRSPKDPAILTRSTTTWQGMRHQEAVGYFERASALNPIFRSMLNLGRFLRSAPPREAKRLPPHLEIKGDHPSLKRHSANSDGQGTSLKPRACRAANGNPDKAAGYVSPVTRASAKPFEPELRAIGGLIEKRKATSKGLPPLRGGKSATKWDAMTMRSVNTARQCVSDSSTTRELVRSGKS